MVFLRRLASAKSQEYGWHEPCKSRGLRTVLWAAGGEIPPADPAEPGAVAPHKNTAVVQHRRSMNGEPVVRRCAPHRSMQRNGPLMRAKR